MSDSAARDWLRPLPGHPGTWYVSPAAAQRHLGVDIGSLPRSLRVLAENLLRNCVDPAATIRHLRALAAGEENSSIPFHPGRILLQDASGLPVLADLAVLRERVAAEGLPVEWVATRKRMDLVVDHAVELDAAGSAAARRTNEDREYERHARRFRFLRWCENRIPGLRVVPPGVGICHQLNLEVLADVVHVERDGERNIAAFDTMVGTDSHSTMINALGVVGWGVGGIEATAAALGQPLFVRVPPVVGVRVTGRMRPGVVATDVALRLAAMLREHGVVEKIVEFHGPGLASLSVADRATIANMAPEYGATMAFFPPDTRTLEYLRATGRPADLVADYLRAQGLLSEAGEPEETIRFAETCELDLTRIPRTMAGPIRPHQAVSPTEVAENTRTTTPDRPGGRVVIAAITSCTNTANPSALVTAGLLARRAREHGLRVPDWVKTSFTPGSRSAADILAASGLQDDLDALGFQVAGFGCGTCMGNSGPLKDGVSASLAETGERGVAVLSGNRNFPGRIHPDVADSYLASPALVVAAALAGNIGTNLDTDALGHTPDGKAVRLSDLWPKQEEIDEIVREFGTDALRRAATNALTTRRWRELSCPDGPEYEWEDEAGSIRRPPFADEPFTSPAVSGDIHGAAALLVLGDDVTTDHISPVARITRDSAAGRWLSERGVAATDFGSFSSRRLNHEVMLRGGFANPRLENLLVPGRTGGWTRGLSPTTGERPPEPVPVHEAAADFARAGVPAVVVAGHRYGAGSARDWAAKVTRLLGVRAVVARGFERIHRTNLVAMGVLPVECPDLDPAELDAGDRLDLLGVATDSPTVEVVLRRRDRVVRRYRGRKRLDNDVEASWLRHGGVVGQLLARLRAAANTAVTDA
jgi:aconitate hydratase